VHIGYALFLFDSRRMKRVKLSDRLKAIAGKIDDGASVADIGTDHGFLPVYLAQNGFSGRIIASDISSASLGSALRLAEETGVAEAITFLSAPGLDSVSPVDVDTIVIAGMGGETILGILQNAPWTKQRDIKLILQPQSKVYLLSRFLYDNGYVIKETVSVTDRGKCYIIFLAAGVDI